MGILENFLKTVILDQAIITEKVKLSSEAFKIRLQSESIHKMNFIPGSFLRMAVGIGKEEGSIKDKVRSYSIWGIDLSAGYLDVAIATHSKGIGTQWVKECQWGDMVYFKMKKGNFLSVDDADSYLMIGDLSALSHLYMINRNIGEKKQIASVLYSQQKSELFPDIDGNTPFDFYEFPENPINEIIAKIKEIAPTLKGKKMAYIAGDSRLCVAVNQFLRKELNWEAKQIKTKLFWNREKKGLE